MKQCSKCKVCKPDGSFNFLKGKKNRLEERCKECVKKRNSAYYQKNKEVLKGKVRAYAKANSELVKRYHKKAAPIRQKKLKLAALNKVGMQCACCGESRFEFLSIDHVKNDGHIHRREISHGNLYHRVVMHNDDQRYELQTLCFNCNFGKRYNGGICPHRQYEGSETILNGSKAKRPEAHSTLKEVEDIVRSKGKLLAA